MAQTLAPPPHSNDVLVSFPAEHVLLLTLNRPKALNAMTPTMTSELEKLLNWFEAEQQLCWNNDQQSGNTSEQERMKRDPHGFGSISRRRSVKPIIAAVRGGAYGGGMEMLLNCDYVVASTDSKFSLPEVKRGVIAAQGGIPRLAAAVGHQLASELLLLGKTIDAADARNRFGFVNQVVPAPQVLEAAIAVARQITSNSPDAVQSTKECLLISQEVGVHETFARHLDSPATTRVYKGTNIKEGLKAFTEKRSPVWGNPAKL